MLAVVLFAIMFSGSYEKQMRSLCSVQAQEKTRRANKGENLVSEKTARVPAYACMGMGVAYTSGIRAAVEATARQAQSLKSEQHV